MSVSGIDELKAALDELPRSTGKAVAKCILLKRGQTIAERARERVRVRSGRARRNIRVTLLKGAGQASKTAVMIGTRLFYARFLEFGTVHQPPHPFLRPALDETRQQVLDGIKGDLWAEIKRAAERLSRKKAKG